MARSVSISLKILTRDGGVGLAGAVVGVLAEDDDFDLVQGGAVQGVEAVSLLREQYFARLFLGGQEFGQLQHVGLAELVRQPLIPAAAGLQLLSQCLGRVHGLTRFPVSVRPCVPGAWPGTGSRRGWTVSWSAAWPGGRYRYPHRRSAAGRIPEL